MVVVVWDKSNPTAGDCYSIATWLDMVTYIKHSHSCNFTIYDDELSTSQKFKFSYFSFNNTMEGDDTSLRNLILKANTADTYPYIKLFGNSDIQANFKTGRAFYLYDSAVQALKVSYTSGPNKSFIAGGNVSGDRLVLKGNSFDADAPTIELDRSNAAIRNTSTHYHFWYAGATQLMRLIDGFPGTCIEGGTTTGYILTLKANNTDAYPKIELLGNSDITLKTGSAVKYITFGVYAAKTAEIFDGYIIIKDEAGNLRKLMTCA